MKTNNEILSDLENLISETKYEINIGILQSMPSRVVFQFKVKGKEVDFVKVLCTFYKHRFTFYPSESFSGFSIDLSELRYRCQIKDDERRDAIKVVKRTSLPEKKEDIKPLPEGRKDTQISSWCNQADINFYLELKKNERKNLIEQLKQEGKLGTRPEPVVYDIKGKKTGSSKKKKQLTKRLQEFEDYRLSL